MDNQQSNEGSARDVGLEGSSMGRDLDSGRSEAKGGTGSVGGMGSGSGMGNIGGNDSMSKDAGRGMPSIKAADVHKTIDKAAEAARPMVDRLANRAHTSVDKMSSMLGGASQTMSERSRQVNEAYRQMAESGREYIRNNPGTAVAIALGAGFVLARMLGRRP